MEKMEMEKDHLRKIGVSRFKTIENKFMCELL